LKPQRYWPRQFVAIGLYSIHRSFSIKCPLLAESDPSFL